MKLCKKVRWSLIQVERDVYDKSRLLVVNKLNRKDLKVGDSHTLVFLNRGEDAGIKLEG